MTFLLDTCALSELTKPKPNQGVLQWFAEQDELALYVAAPTLGELWLMTATALGLLIRRRARRRE